MRPLVLVILDGWGYSSQKLGNALRTAATPNLDLLEANYPALLLQASARAVGLQWGEPGNSEVGHLTIGAGRTVFQYDPRIAQAIQSGEFFKNPALTGAMDHAVKNGSSLHLSGLLGSGTVHSRLDHLLTLMDMAKQRGVTKLFLHLLADGKDSGLQEAPSVIQKVQNHIAGVGLGTIATVIGRYYGMDRDNNWDRTQAAYDLMTSGKGQTAGDIAAALQEHYRQGLTDTKMAAIVADPTGLIQDKDAVIFFNFREDSMRQISRSFVDPKFDKFPHKDFSDLWITLMTQYLEEPDLQLNVAFPLPVVKNGLAETLSTSGKRQLHVAETEKFAHTTYFFNCLHNEPYPGESDILIESHKKHPEHPEMRSREVAEKLAEELNKDGFDFGVINLSNADIISHLGILELAIQGAAAVDEALGLVRQAVAAKDGIMLVTADHGNAESLVYRGTGEMETKHNLNPVPFFIVAKEYERPRTPEELAYSFSDPSGLLSDIAPTVLELMQVPIPPEMTGTSLLPLLRR